MVKKKSADEWKKEGEEVKAIFSAARTKEHNCAIVLCSEGVAIEADPRLPAENLKKKAKKRDGATAKGVMAKLNVKGSSIELCLLEEPPSGFEKKFKQYLLKIGVKMKANFIMPEEKGGEDKENAAGTEAQSADLKPGQLQQDEAEASKKIGVRGMDAVAKKAETDRTAPKAQKASTTEAKNRKKGLTKAFADLKPELLRSIQIANPEHKVEMQKLVQAFGKEMQSNAIEASQATFEAFKSKIEAFDLTRAKGRAERKRQFGDIQTRAEEIAQRLEQLAAQRGEA